MTPDCAPRLDYGALVMGLLLMALLLDKVRPRLFLNALMGILLAHTIISALWRWAPGVFR